MSGKGLKLPPAATTANGLWTSGAQSINGQKNFSNKVGLGALNLSASTLTVASNTITKTGSYHQISTGSGAVSITTINGGTAGDILFLRTTSSSNAATLVDGTGNIALVDNRDYVLNSTDKVVGLIYSGSLWLQLSLGKDIVATDTLSGTVGDFIEWQSVPGTLNDWFTVPQVDLNIVDYRYTKIGKTVYFQIFIDALGGGGKTATEIQVTVPVPGRNSGEVRHAGCFTWASSSGAGLGGSGDVLIIGDGSYIRFFFTASPSTVEATALVGTDTTSTNGYIRACGFYEAAS